MATGPEHYAEAERLIAQADEWLDGEDAPDSFELVHARRAEDLAAAQVHATLALAAATALNDSAPGAPVALSVAPVWWLDDGQENPGKPPLFTSELLASEAAIKRYTRDNSFSDLGLGDFEWLAPEDDEDASGDTELVARDRRTGIFVRPIRPKDGA